MTLSLRRLENFYGCPYDFVEIFDGPQRESFSLGRFCSSTTSVFTSSSNRLTVVFHSDAIITNIGFYATYESLVQDENDTGRSFGRLGPGPCLVSVAGSDGRLCAWSLGIGKGFPCSLVYPRDPPGESGWTPNTAVE